MKRTLLITLPLMISGTVEACTEVFVHRSNTNMVGRTMDFPINMGNTIVAYNKGYHQVSAYFNKKFPDAKVAEWDVKYPFLGREIFETGLVLDGANTQGLSAAYLYLPDTKFPQYNPSETRLTLSFYDLATYALATSKNVDEALNNIAKYQISGGSIMVEEGIAVSDVPIHMSLKDKTGNSAVIEAINGKLHIYKGEKAGNVLTNYPELPGQFKNLANYNSLLNYNKKEQKAKFGDIPGYKVMIDSSSLRNNIVSMIGIPGDYSPPSRFVRATFLEKNIPTMNYTSDYIYMIQHILNSVTVPYSILPNSTATQWHTLKDLDHNEITYKNILFLYKGKLISARNNIASYNLNQIFSTGVKSINGKGKLKSQIKNAENIKFYTMDELTAGN